MKFGLIGCGYWGKNLIRDLYNLNVLDTICDLDQEQLNKFQKLYTNINVTTNFDDILNNKEITAVIIATPSKIHHKFAKLSLLADKDVYVEKPITLDIGEAKELNNIAKKKQKILMVGHILQYHPCIIKAKELIKNGKIGKIKNIISNRLNLGIFRNYDNVLWEFGPHDISVILSLCDNQLPSTINCFGSANLTPGVHDIVNSVLNFDNLGIYVNINVSWLNAYKEAKLTIVGEKGMIVFDDMEPNDKLILLQNYNDNFKAKKINEIREVIPVDMTVSPLKLECEHFIKCCKNRTVPLSNGDEGIRVLKVLTDLQNKLSVKKSDYFAHETATVDPNAIIGDGTKIWHYSHICSGAKIGKNCNIGQNCYIAGGAIIGDNCKIQNNVSVYDGIVCEDYVFLGPSCVLTNDINPRTKHPKNSYLKTLIKEGATIGANATIVCRTTIGKNSLVGAGCVVVKDVEDNSVVVGNPSRTIGKIDEFGKIIKE